MPPRKSKARPKAKPKAGKAPKPRPAKAPAKRPRPPAARPARSAPAPPLDVGQPAPDVAFLDQEGRSWKLSDLRGRAVVLYFYPKDMTSGCTTEACEFNAALPAYDMHGAMVVGVSPDDAASHQKFRAKHRLDFPLAFDPSMRIFEAFGVWKEKNLYGRKHMGVERSTFLIDPEGVVRAAWRKVRPEGHAQEVLATLEKLGAGA